MRIQFSKNEVECLRRATRVVTGSIVFRAFAGKGKSKKFRALDQLVESAVSEVNDDDGQLTVVVKEEFVVAVVGLAAKYLETCLQVGAMLVGAIPVINLFAGDFSAFLGKWAPAAHPAVEAAVDRFQWDDRGQETARRLGGPSWPEILKDMFSGHAAQELREAAASWDWTAEVVRQFLKDAEDWSSYSDTIAAKAVETVARAYKKSE